MRTGIRTRCTLALTLAAMTTGRPPEAADPQGSVASKPEAVTTDGVPEIPASTFEELQPYQDIRSASFADWLPSGGIVFSSRIGNVTQLYRSLTPHAVPEEVTSGEEPVAGGELPSRWSRPLQPGQRRRRELPDLPPRPGVAEPRAPHRREIPQPVGAPR
jgi:hypothetical protein